MKCAPNSTTAQLPHRMPASKASLSKRNVFLAQRRGGAERRKKTFLNLHRTQREGFVADRSGQDQDG